MADGRAYLTASEDKYDVIMVDAYQDITIPFQLSSVEFFTEVSEHLKENGVMVVNLNMASDQEGSINDYLCDTMARCSAMSTPQTSPATPTGRYFVPTPTTCPRCLRPAGHKVGAGGLCGNYGQCQRRSGGVPGWRSDPDRRQSPVELLGMQVLDEIIADELAYYRGCLPAGSWIWGAMLG